jgi:phosphoribosylformylglycinamidine synthase
VVSISRWRKEKAVREQAVTPELVVEHGLNEEEHRRIKEILGREMTFTELGIFSVMWSEHCSYKNSILLLKTLPRTGPNLLVEAGEENAGIVDIGDGRAVVFKIESHNHPSAVEPYQGAATGVGGILRDVFTMGARPIASLNSRRFGNPEDPKVRYLLDGVVRGIGDYGNSFGVPTIGGEIYFEDAYTTNCLVNPMAVGIVRTDRIARAAASVVGSPVYVVGSRTGRDGIHGATFASEELTEKSEARRPAVQIGDPFTEKLLLEATLEIIKQDLIVGIQDMGAAGITCSCSETAFSGEQGIEIDIAKVPVREEGMIPYETLLSESQERMLVIVKKGREDDVGAIFKKWGLMATKIGEVISGGNFKVYENGELKSEIPAATLALGGGTPVYQREKKRPPRLEETRNFDFSTIPVPPNLSGILQTLIGTPNIASKEWVYQQYDGMVRTNTAVNSGSDASIVRIRKTKTALAMTTDGNGRYCFLNPRRGAQIAVAEAARNLVCSGARPLAITNCLNFGNPDKPEMYYLFAECVRGMGEACRVFATPVTGGNVSFYNEDPDRAVYPTPTIGMIGLIDDVDYITTQWFKKAGDLIILIGTCREDIGGSEYLKTIHGKITGDAPYLDLDEEKRVQQFVLAAIRAGLVNSAHDVSDGGLAVCLAECCITNPDTVLGCEAKLPTDFRPDAVWFGESQSRIVVSLSEKNRAAFEKLTADHAVPMHILGKVNTGPFRITEDDSLDVGKLKEAYYTCLPKLMERTA